MNGNRGQDLARCGAGIMLAYLGVIAAGTGMNPQVLAALMTAFPVLVLFPFLLMLARYRAEVRRENGRPARCSASVLLDMERECDRLARAQDGDAYLPFPSGGPQPPVQALLPVPGGLSMQEAGERFLKAYSASRVPVVLSGTDAGARESAERLLAAEDRLAARIADFSTVMPGVYQDGIFPSWMCHGPQCRDR